MVMVKCIYSLNVPATQQVAVAEKLISVFTETGLDHNHQMIGGYFANPFSAKLKRWRRRFAPGRWAANL